ncbi:MAG: FG-GAP repeat domain-containing protein, partial [Thermoplasmata archaeon]
MILSRGMWDMTNISITKWASYFLAALFFASFFSFATVEMDQNTTVAKAPDSEPSADEPVTFTNVSEQVGFAGVRGSRFSWADYDKDGDQDLLINGRRLYRNNGAPNWNFTEVTGEAGLYGSVSSGVWADYDNDGWLDFYATASIGQWDILWRNNGDGTFENVTVEAGNIYDNLQSRAAGWGDYDNDGHVDLYVSNYEKEMGINTMDLLWHNNGDGTFSNATLSAG